VEKKAGSLDVSPERVEPGKKKEKDIRGPVVTQSAGRLRQGGVISSFGIGIEGGVLLPEAKKKIPVDQKRFRVGVLKSASRGRAKNSTGLQIELTGTPDPESRRAFLGWGG